MNYIKIFEQIAREHRTTPEEVRQEIQQMIDNAFDHPANDLAAYRLRQPPSKGAPPPPEDSFASPSKRFFEGTYPKTRRNQCSGGLFSSVCLFGGAVLHAPRKCG